MKTACRTAGKTCVLRQMTQSFFLLFCIVLLNGCAAGSNAQPEETNGPYALEGPPLHIVGSYGDIPVKGTMERFVMIGMGKMELTGTRPEDGFFAEARLNTEPGKKARIRGVLETNENAQILFSLQPQGPDQGIGVGQSEDGQTRLLFFFHCSAEEAERRFPLIKQQLLTAAEKQRK